jgi:ribosome-binding factor A
MLRGKRAIRVGDQIQKEIALVLLEKVKDPRVRDVTITGVRVTNDLKFASIYFSVLDEKKYLKNAKEGLTSAKGFIKREIATRLELKYVPDITFIHDYSLESGDRIDRLLEELGTNASKRIDK